MPHIRFKVLATCIGLLLLAFLLLNLSPRTTPVVSTLEAPAEEVPQVVWKKPSTPQFTFTKRQKVERPIVENSLPPTKMEAVETLKSFTTLPESLKRPEVARAVIKYEGAVSSIVAMAAQLNSFEEPYEPLTLSDDPTDEELIAEGANKTAYNKRVAEYRKENDVYRRSASLGDGSEARQKLAEDIGPEAFADYQQWKMSQNLACLLSWSMSEEATRATAEKAAALWRSGHGPQAIFQALPEINLSVAEGSDTRHFLTTTLSRR